MTDSELGTRLFPERQKSALLLLHLQNGVIHRDGVIGSRGLGARVAAAGLVPRVQQAQTAADDRGVPVINTVSAFHDGVALSTAPLLQAGAKNGLAAGTWDTEVYGALARPGDRVLEHSAMSAFAGTGLESILTGLGIDRVVLAGVGTHLVVAATAFAASDLGLETTVLADCCAAPSDDIHTAALAQLSAISSLAQVQL